MSHSLAQQAIETNTTVPAPRFRSNLTVDLPLTTTWKRLDFAGASTLNANSFPLSPDGLNKNVYWDSTNKLFRFAAGADRNYDVNLNMRITSSNILSLLNVSIANIQLRYVIPGSTANPFPLPDSDQCINIMKAGLSLTDNASDNRVISATSVIRQYGLGVEMRLSSSFLGTATATLNAADILIYGR